MKMFTKILISILAITFSFGLVLSTEAQIIQIIGGACSVTPATANIGDTVTWAATGAGGIQPYSYTWNGTENISGTTQNISVRYLTPGSKQMSVTIQSADGQITFRNCAVQIGNISYSALPTNYYNHTAFYPQNYSQNQTTNVVGGTVSPYTNPPTQTQTASVIQAGSVNSNPLSASVGLSQVPYTGLTDDFTNSFGGIATIAIIFLLTGITAYTIRKVLVID